MTGEPLVLTPNRDDVRIAWLAALAILIHIAESALPTPLPGAKPGFANIITVVALLLFGWRSAAWITVLRVLGGSLALGSFLTPTFLLSLSGALTNIVMLGLCWWLLRDRLGALGYSVAGAMAHMTGQFAAAYFLFIPHPGMLRLLPVLLSAALILGCLNGIISAAVFNRLQNHGHTGTDSDTPHHRQ